MGRGSGIKTAHGELAGFPTVGEGIKQAYYSRLRKMWPNAIELFKENEITADGINRAFNTGGLSKISCVYG